MEPPRRYVLAVNDGATSAGSRESPSRPSGVESDHPPLVLVVEDDTAILDLYCEVLEEQGFRVIPWSALPAESSYVATLAPDLVILNLLFDLDDQAWQFLERLNAEPAAVAVPVLVCATDVTLLERVADRLGVWACGALLKPFDLEQFLVRVRTCLGAAPGPGSD
jgi:DNA-binding response OmpR family regulator